jgi:catechol 2,3-dioxygenase-like lactoylglutathione lyase family enzyme
MTPVLEQLAEVMIFVDDLAATRAWFVAFLGIEPYLDAPEAVGFRIGPHELHLRPADSKSPARSAGSVAYWQVASVDAAIVRASTLGAVVHRGPGDVPEAGIRICQVREPGGTVFGMLQRLR